MVIIDDVMLGNFKYHPLKGQALQLMKDGAIVSNSGHFNVELDLEGLAKIASEEAKVSTRYTRGWWRSSPSLVLADHMTPEETIIFSEVRSQRPGEPISERRVATC